MHIHIKFDCQCLALTYIRQINWVNSRNDLYHDDSTINIVPDIIIIIIIKQQFKFLTLTNSFG